MNILHVTQNYFPSEGGTQYMMQQLSEYFKNNFNDGVKVYTTNSYYGPGRSAFRLIDKPLETINDIEVQRFPFTRMHKKPIKFFNKVSVRLFQKQLPFYLAYTLQSGPVSYPLYKAMLNDDADIIGASSMHYMFADYPQWRRFSKNPKPFVLYGALHIQKGLQLTKRYINRINNAEYYIANTLFEKEFLSNYIHDTDKIKVIGTATDIYKDAEPPDAVALHRESIGVRKEEKLILYLGRHEDWKGIPVLLEAFYSLQKKYQNIKLVIAGAATNYTAALQKISAENPAVIICSNLSHKEKCLVLPAADMLVLPSGEESFGVVFIEAWSFCKPVIGANIGAVASVIDNGKDGLLFETNNSESLYKCIELLLNDTDKSISFGNAGYQKVQQKYTWKIIAPAFRNVYEMAIEKFHSQKNNKQ